MSDENVGLHPRATVERLAWRSSVARMNRVQWADDGAVKIRSPSVRGVLRCVDHLAADAGLSSRTIESITQLLRDTIELAGGLYRKRDTPVDTQWPSGEKTPNTSAPASSRRRDC